MYFLFSLVSRQIFKAQPSLNANEVLALVKKDRPRTVAISYLSWLIVQQGDNTPELHRSLIELYVEQIRELRAQLRAREPTRTCLLLCCPTVCCSALIVLVGRIASRVCSGRVRARHAGPAAA